MKKNTIIKAMTIGAACAVAGVAQAGPTVNVQYNGTGSGKTVKITYNSKDTNVFAGQLKHTLSGATGDYAWTNKQWLTYCTDLDQTVSSSKSVFMFDTLSNMPAGQPMGADKAAAVQSLFNFANGAQVAPSITADYATAFQLAVWEIVTDYAPGNGLAGLSLTSGNFKARNSNGSTLSTSIGTIFNTLISGAMSPTLTGVEVLGISSSVRQDQIFQVPAPGSLALAGFGALLMRRRRGAQR